jgi:hypothetical protein
MQQSHLTPPGGPALPEWVGLKWLMGACGLQVSVDRLLSDRPYALNCLGQALGIGDPILSSYAARLHDRMLRAD